MTRIDKKKLKLGQDSDKAMSWFIDHRAYLLEAMFENIDIRIINKQFKEKFTKGGRHKRNVYLKRTLMSKYISIAIN